jgi:hypothetical protein
MKRYSRSAAMLISAIFLIAGCNFKARDGRRLCFRDFPPGEEDSYLVRTPDRLITVRDGRVFFSWKDYANDGEQKTTSFKTCDLIELRPQLSALPLFAAPAIQYDAICPFSERRIG